MMDIGRSVRVLALLTRSIRGTSVGLLAYSVANYLTLAIAARALDSRAFALFTAYYALLSLLLVPASCLRISAVQAVADRARLPIAGSLGSVLFVSVVGTIGVSKLVSDPLALANGALVILATLLAATGWLGRGDLQAGERYRRYTVGLLAEAISRIAFLTGLLFFHTATLTLVLLVVVASRALGHIGISTTAFGVGQTTPAKPWLSWARNEYLPMVVANALVVALYSIDVLILNARFPTAAADYGALTIAGRFILFAGYLVSEAYIGIRPYAGRRVFAILFGINVLLWVPMVIVSTAAPFTIVALLAGSKHLGLAPYLRSYAIFSVANSLINILFLEGMLAGRRVQTSLALAVSVAVEVGTLGVVVRSVPSFMEALVWIGGFVVVPVSLGVLLPTSLNIATPRLRRELRPIVR